MLHRFSLFACFGCSFNSASFFVVCMWLGSPLLMYFLLKPYGLAQLKKVWGLPRFQIPDLISLTCLLAWPTGLARLFGGKHDAIWLLKWFSVFALITGFIWLRGLWILQQREVESFAKRTIFLGLLLPAILLLGCIASSGTLVLLGATFDFDPELFLIAIAHGAVFAILLAVIMQGLTSVFGPRRFADAAIK